MTTGERIRSLRTQLGMSQSELGQKIGVKTPAIYKYENGLVVNLKRSTIESLADALGVTPSYLMGFEDEKLPTPISEGGHAGKNVIRAIGRDGSVTEKHLTDEQLAAYKAMLDTLPNADDL